MKLIGVISETMEKALKSHEILARRSNALRDILLATEQEVKQLTSSILATKSILLQTEYIGACKTKVTLHGVAVDISEERMESFLPSTSEGRLGDNEQGRHRNRGLCHQGDTDPEDVM